MDVELLCAGPFHLIDVLTVHQCKHERLVVRNERIIGSDQTLEVIRCERCGALISVLYPERDGKALRRFLSLFRSRIRRRRKKKAHPRH